MVGVTDAPHTDPDDDRDRDLEAERREHRQGWLLLGAIFGGLALLVVLAAAVS
jgi:hypothetical protein